MSEIKATIVGAFLGGALSLGGIWFQSSASESQITKHAKREKLDALMENIIQAHSCIYSSSSLKKEECKSDKSTLRPTMLSYIYFPSLKKYAEEYSLAIEKLKSEIVECEITHLNSETDADLDCISAAIDKSDAAKQFLIISEKVESTANTLW